MTNKTRRTEIQIETHKVTVIRTRGRRFPTYCQRCQTTVAALTPEQTAAFFQQTVAEVHSLIGVGEFHLVGTEDGLPLVCGNAFGNENKSLVQKASPNQF